MPDIDLTADYLSIVDRIYSAIEDDEAHWQKIASQIAGFFPRSWAWIVDVDSIKQRIELTGLSNNTNLPVFHRFANEFNSPERNPFYQFVPEMPVCRLVDRRDYMADESFMQTDLYGLWKQAGIYHCGTSILDINEGRLATLVMSREAGSDYWDERERTLIDHFGRHLRRAILLRRKLTEAEAKNRAMLQALDKLNLAIGLLDDFGRLLFVNTALDRLLIADDGLGASQGRLSTARSRDQKALNALIDASLQRLVKHPHSQACVAIERPSGLRPFLLAITPLLDTGNIFHGRSIAAAIVVADPEGKPALPIETLRTLLGLTTREAEVVAELVRGQTQEEIADKLGVSRETVKLHLKRSFAKTGTGRQSELVSLVLRTPAAQILR